MLKHISFVILLFIVSVGFAEPIKPQANINTENMTKLTVTKSWRLTPWHDLLYIISNPVHAELNFIIDIAPTTKDALGFPVESAPIKLTCGDQIFYISSFDSGGITVCTTKDDIRLDLIHLDGNPSEGKYTLQIK